MELKIFLSVLLVFVPIVFHSNRANASPANTVPTDHVPEQLAALTGHHSNKKTASLITDKRPVFRTVDPRSQQFTAVSYFGQIHEQNQNFAFILNVTYTDGWLVYDIFGVTYWQGGQGYVIVSDGGLDQNYWTVTWYLPANVSATFSIQVTIYRETAEYRSAALPSEYRPVLQLHTFDDMELYERAPPEITNEIKYNKL